MSGRVRTAKRGGWLYLEVHVVVCGHEVALVLHAPLEPDKDGLASQVGQERLRVDDLASAERQGAYGQLSLDYSGECTTHLERHVRVACGSGDEELTASRRSLFTRRQQLRLLSLERARG